MAECPKCNASLRLTDWKPNCPHCGANIVIYDLQERLMKEADEAEVQYYHFQKKIDCFKAVFAGSKLSVVRIVTSLLPLAALLLPVVNLSLAAPFSEYSGNTGIIQIINLAENFSFSALTQVLFTEETKTAALFFILGAVFLLLGIVTMLVHFISLLFTYFPKGKKLLYILDGIFLASSVLSGVMFFAIPENAVISATPSYGLFLFAVLIILCGVMDFLVYREKIEIKHAQCYVGGIPIEEYFEMVEKGVPAEELRNEMYRRLTEMQLQKEAELNGDTNKKEARVNG